jgi:hypothetical protein
MNDSGHNLPAKRNETPLAQPGSLLDAALSKMPKEQQEQILGEALKKRLEIEVQTREADLRFQSSSADMQRTIEQIGELEAKTGSDYTVRSEYETASGKTSIEVRKSNNTVIIVIAIVIGVILLFLVAR